MNRQGDFLSQYALFPKDNSMKHPSIMILNKLFYSSIDLFDGISIVIEQPIDNRIILNVTRSAVIRQYYGAVKPNSAPNIVSRATYGYKSGSNPVGTDFKTYVTKLYDNKMAKMANYLDKLIYLNTYR